MIRANFEDREDGLYYCDGDHHRSEPCQYVKLTEEKLKHLLERSDNSDYAVTAGDQPTPKVCPNCGKENEMYFSKDDRWHCNNCQIHGTGQTFA